MRFDVISLTAGFAATASAQCVGNYFSFYNRAGNAMSYQRLDPGLFPGTESPHLHSFDGGNGLSKSMGFADTQASDCTTARVKTDKSLYWRPTLFFTNGTKLYRVPELSTKIYYKYGDGNNWANVTAYPEDFKSAAQQAAYYAPTPYRSSDHGEQKLRVRSLRPSKRTCSRWIMVNICHVSYNYTCLNCMHAVGCTESPH